LAQLVPTKTAFPAAVQVAAMGAALGSTPSSSPVNP
jgi:hypothetical protein